MARIKGELSPGGSVQLIGSFIKIVVLLLILCKEIFQHEDKA